MNLRGLDERFWAHRLRATSFAGMAGAVLAGGLFLYRHVAQGVWSWDLLAVLATMAVVKLGAMAWFRATR